jgi:ABC-type glycerol-3-phosphate transport system substrate-binding protein
MKRILVVLLALSMLVIPASLASAADTSEHVVINYLVTGNIPTNKTLTETLPILNALLTEKVNAELKVQWIEWTDYLSNYNLAIASQNGNLDLIGTATDWLDAWPNAQNGGFMPLSEELLQTYAPLTWAQVPPENWETCKLYGEIYLIPEDHYAQWTNHGFMIRGDWAAEAGLADGAHSWEDMGVYFQYIKDNKPGVIPWDAKPDASLVTQIAGGWLSSHSQTIFIEGLPVALFYGESPEDPYTVSRYFLEGDDFIAFAKNQRAWSEAGYWKEDVLNNTSIDTRQEMEEGISGSDQHHSQTFYNGERVRMDEKQPGSELSFFWFGEETKNLVALNITHGAMALAATSKNPERALMVYDLLRNDEEVYRLFNYGVEGVQYLVDGNVMTRPEGYVEDTDGSSFNYWWGRNDALELISPNTAVPQRDALTTVYDEVAILYPYGKVVFNLDPISSELDNLSNVFNSYMPQLVYGKQADPEAYVAEFRAQLEAAGYSRAIAEVERQMAVAYAE